MDRRRSWWAELEARGGTELAHSSPAVAGTNDGSGLPRRTTIAIAGVLWVGANARVARSKQARTV